MTCWSWTRSPVIGREIVGELRLKNDAVPLKVAQRQRDDLARGLVQIQRLERELPLAEQRTQPRDHIRGAVAIANGPPRGFARAVDVRRIGIQHPKARAGVGDDARERLVDLMSDRGGQRAQGRDPRHMRELGAGPVQGLLRDHALRHVLKGADEHRSTRDLLDDMGDSLAHASRRRWEVTIRKTQIDVHAPSAARDHGVERRQVVGVDDVSNPLHRDLRRRDRTRRCGRASSDQLWSSPSEVRDEAARLAQPLGVGETVVGPPELRLGPLSVFDVGVDAVPFDDGAGFIAQRVRTEQEPAILAVMPAQSRFGLSRRSEARCAATWPPSRPYPQGGRQPSSPNRSPVPPKGQ